MRLMTSHSNRLCQVVVGTILVTLLCGFGYAQELEGHWRGDWHSQSTGHRGRLSATFCQTSPTQVEARFRGTFAKIVPFRYRAKLEIVHQEPGLIVLSGSKKLGPVMGEFSYHAEIQNGCFSASYASKRDLGTWTLSQTR